MTAIEGLCCDCIHDGPCCDYSENTQCKFYKPDGSCWQAYNAFKLDRSRWGKCEMCGDGEVNASPGAHDFIIADDCLFYNDSEFGLEGVLIKYCPFCSRPLTEEAWTNLERRIGGSNGTTD